MSYSNHHVDAGLGHQDAAKEQIVACTDIYAQDTQTWALQSMKSTTHRSHHHVDAWLGRQDTPKDNCLQMAFGNNAGRGHGHCKRTQEPAGRSRHNALQHQIHHLDTSRMPSTIQGTLSQPQHGQQPA
jgi:hypothetical protein